jgi:Mn2+/Fe2+ NRAMP family transporter
MGKYTNSHWFNIVSWLTAIIVTVLSLMWMWNLIRG